MKRSLYLCASLATLAACRGEVSEDPPITLLRNMHRQQRVNPQAASAFYSDRRGMRAPPEGTVPRFTGGQNAVYADGTIGRDEGFADDGYTLGLETDSPTYVTTIPERAAREHGGAEAMVRRGQQRFAIYCTPCHGNAGDGRGVVFLRGQGGNYQYPQPGNLNDTRMRHMPDGQLFATISNGVRNMPAYSAQILVRDRWAVVAYVRALQLSQVPATGATP